MQITVADLLTSQLRLIGAISAGETPDDADLQDALQANNLMLDSWSARRLMVRALVQESFSLVQGKSAYTIGIGGDFDTAKPVAIPNAFTRDAGGTDQPMDIVTVDVFNAQSDKAISAGLPIMLWYDPGLAQQTSQLGTINIYMTPDQAYTLFIEEQKYLTEFVNLTDLVTFEPAYFRAIKFNGAMEIYYEYRKHTQMIPPEVKKIAADSLRIVENMNTTLIVASCDLPGSGKGRYNVMTDSFY